MTVTAVNDGPITTVPGVQTAAEEGSIVFSTGYGNAIIVAYIDVDETASPNNTVQVVLSVANGTLTLGTTNNITIPAGANGTAAVTIVGTIAAVNAALGGLTYTGNLDFNGSDPLSVLTSDLGHTGSPGAQLDTDLIPITITPVNDVPTANPDTRSVFEYQTVTGNVVAGDAFGGQQDTDPDNSLTVTAFTGSGTSFAGVYGHLTAQSDGSYSYIADKADPLAFGATVQDVFIYSVWDGVTTVSSTLTVTVTGSNIGNSAANQLIGSPGPDPLFGGGGNDTMSGGLGDDFYEVDDAGDVVIEQPGQGTNDRIWAYVDYTLPANVEHLILQGAAVTGIGNSGDNVIRGNDLDNVLYGAGGHDVMFGGKGNDFFEVDSSDDQIVELPGEGFNDRIWSSADYVLPVNVESLTLIGTAESGTGNAEGNVIHGNAIANRITGAGGDDLLFGEAGGDTFLFGLNFGHDVLADFQGGAGASDRLEFSTSVFANEAAFRAASHQIGPDVVVVFNAANHMVIANTTIAQIHNDDLLFV